MHNVYSTVKNNAMAYNTDLLAGAKNKLAAWIISFCLRGGFGHAFHEAASQRSQLWSHSIVPTDNLTRTLKACPCMHMLAPPGLC
jgi:hypothetical protein